MVQAHRPVDGVYPATGHYAHAMEVRGAQRLLFVAGTMGLRQDGTPGATLAEQLDLVEHTGHPRLGAEVPRSPASDCPLWAFPVFRVSRVGAVRASHGR